MEFFITLLQISIIVGIICWCADIAKRNGRNVTLACIMGFLFGIFAVIGYYIAGEKKAKSERIDENKQ